MHNKEKVGGCTVLSIGKHWMQVRHLKKRAKIIVSALKKERNSTMEDGEQKTINYLIERYKKFILLLSDNSIEDYRKTYLIYGGSRIAIEGGCNYYSPVYNDMYNFERYLHAIIIDPRR